jgi:hypothetical protein
LRVAMSVLVNTDDVEVVAKTWLEKKYAKKLGKVKFVGAMLENGVWNVKAEVKLSTGVLSLSSRIVEVRIDPTSTDVLGYSESEPPE